MTGEQERYPPPIFSGAADVSPAALWSSSSAQHSKFEASRDWSWTPAVPAGPWSSSPGQWHHQQPLYYGQQQYAGHHHHHHHHHPRRDVWRGSGQHQWGKKKQQKEPEFSHFCDTCDRGFKTQDKYEEHISQHVKCSVEDCRFTAHEKLVKIHWRNIHGPGAKRIKLDTAEDVAKWREERRKNYPTLRNVEKKLKLVEVKEQRGDVLETPQFGRIKSHSGSHQLTALKRPHQDRDPLAALADSEPDSDKDESVEQTQTGLTIAPKCVTSALGSLMSSYGDEMTSSESERDTDDAVVLKASLALEENKTLLDAHALPVQRSAAVQEEKHTDRPQQSHHAPAARGRGRGRGGGRGGRNKPAEPQRRRPTLLEMLLAPDVRHERNVVLQCVRYIVRNGFFGLAGKDSHEIKVSVNTNVGDASDEDGTRDEGRPSDPQTDAEKRSETTCDVRCVNESPASVFRQLFAQGLVCDDPEQT